MPVTWHVVTVREWRNRVPHFLFLKETFASEAKAKVVAREMRKDGLDHKRCLRETHYVVQSPKRLFRLNQNIFETKSDPSG
jgi:hypothetical protein